MCEPVCMTTKPTYDDVNLILRLYETRREDKMRAAREWFAQNFKYRTMEEFNRGCPPGSSMNAYARMVLGYWDMAASLVTTDAIDADAFRAAHGEIFATFGKIQPLLAELRAASGEPDFCRHVEAVVTGAPDGNAILTRRREALRAAAKSRGATAGA